MKYYLVAGEASGDLHGANLMKALKELDPKAEFRFFGGDLMQGQGGVLVKHYAGMAFMGFAEVLLNLNQIFKNLKLCKQDIAAYQPDVLILIDFPGFNLKIAEFAKAAGLMVCYYISPKVWAWNTKRVLKIKRVVDHLFCILPFEVDFYKQWGMDIDYVGNPLLDAVDAFTPDPGFMSKNNLEKKKVIALLPGSRKQEISRLLPQMAGIVDEFPDHQFIVAGAPAFDAGYYTPYLAGKDIPVVFGSTYDLLNVAEGAIVASGTANLETALFNVPQVVCYIGNPLSVMIGRLLIRIKYISLVNLIMDKCVVNELIQQDCTTAAIKAELCRLIYDGTYRNTMLENYDLLDRRMGTPGASAKTASLVIKYAAKK